MQIPHLDHLQAEHYMCFHALCKLENFSYKFIWLVIIMAIKPLTNKSSVNVLI